MKRLAGCVMGFVVTLAAQAALAHDGCCVCGCREELVKVCKAVPDVKKVKVIAWECKCEDICIPGRTLTHDCTPTCGESRTVKKLIRKEVTKEVPSYKWVQETVCVKCCDSGGLLHRSRCTAPELQSLSPSAQDSK